MRHTGSQNELGSGIRNINKYLRVYSGGTPEFFEDNVFRLTVPIKKYKKKKDTHQDNTQDRVQDEVQNTHQDTHQDTQQDKQKETHQDKVEKLKRFCKTPRSRAEMQEFIGLRDKVNFKKNYIVPMLEQGIIEMTIPDKPTSRNQRYVAVTDDVDVNSKEET